MLIINANLFDGERFLPGRALRLADGRIAAGEDPAPAPGEEVRDLEGRERQGSEGT